MSDDLLLKQNGSLLEATFNRNTHGVYEMGSTFKIFTTAMALDTGTATLNSSYDATKPIRISRFVITDYKPKKRWLSVPEIFVYSSNIGTVKMALDVGTGNQKAYLARLGLLRPAAIELPEVGGPIVPSPWGKIHTMTIAFGHGIAVSPVQLVSAVAAIVNGGIMRPATLIRRGAGERDSGVRVISARTSERMRRLLRQVVAQGTGRKAAVKGYMVGGKTGVEGDVIPYGSVIGNRARLSGLNIIGLKRRDFSRDEIHDLRRAYRLIFAEEGTLTERLEDVAELFMDNAAVMEIVNFIKADSSRSICQPTMEDAA